MSGCARAPEPPKKQQHGVGDGTDTVWVGSFFFFFPFCLFWAAHTHTERERERAPVQHTQNHQTISHQQRERRGGTDDGKKINSITLPRLPFFSRSPPVRRTTLVVPCPYPPSVLSAGALCRACVERAGRGGGGGGWGAMWSPPAKPAASFGAPPARLLSTFPPPFPAHRRACSL